MLLTRVFGLVALAGAVALPGAAAVERRDDIPSINIDDLLNQMEQNFKDPEYAMSFASAAFAIAAAAQPSGAEPVNQGDMLAALDSMPDIVPAMVSDAVDKVGSVLANADIPASMSGAVSQALSALHDSSVISRINTMISNMFDMLEREYKEGELGSRTGTEEHHRSSKSSASRVGSGMCAAAAAAIACALPMLL